MVFVLLIFTKLACLNAIYSNYFTDLPIALGYLSWWLYQTGMPQCHQYLPIWHGILPIILTTLPKSICKIHHLSPWLH